MTPVYGRREALIGEWLMFISLEIVDYLAKLFAVGVYGRGATVCEDGQYRVLVYPK